MGLGVKSLSDLAGAKVLVVGDTMLDRYWLGSVDRISPEAPVPVVAVKEEQERVGGAANVAMNVASLGGMASLVSVVGDDVAGQRVTELLNESGIQPLLELDTSIRTTVKLRLISRNQQLVRADFEDQPQAESLSACLDKYITALSGHSAVVFSDYGKGGLSHVREMIKHCNEKGIPALVDPKSSDFSPYTGADLITPNLKEFQAVVGDVWELDDITQVAEKVMAEFDLGSMLVTLSERGMVLCRPGKPPLVQSARSREVYDVTGAGDTVIGTMALAFAAKYAPDEAMNLANHAAGIVVTKLGTATASVDELQQSFGRE